MVKHLFGLALLLGVFACGCNGSQMPGDVAASHIQANVPQDKAFDEDMKRDLAAYLCTNMDCHVEYELLRKGATQTGIAYPKFYVWVHGFQHGKEFTQGAARVAAVDGQQFHVTDFLSQDQIRTSPGQVGNVFPAQLVAGILDRARSQSK